MTLSEFFAICNPNFQKRKRHPNKPPLDSTMPEHQIRLRVAWDRLDDSDDPPRRVDLPTVWTVWTVSDPARPFRLLRKFGRPTFDPGAVAVALELLDVPGLVAVRLNGQSLEVKDRIAVDGILQARNLLELDVDLSEAGRIEPGSAWGSIALVIADRSG